MVAMPTSRARLSFVPNQSIASVLTEFGTPSTTRSATSTTGLWKVPETAGTSSATPSPQPAATSPITAPAIDRRWARAGSVLMTDVRSGHQHGIGDLAIRDVGG